MKKSIKKPENEHKVEQRKPDLIIFDLDGCIINSDDFVLTKQQAWERFKVELVSTTSLPITKPRISEKNNFSVEYLYNMHHNIQPYEGILDMFVKFAVSSKVAIVTSRYEILKAKTTEWLSTNIIKRHGDTVWRQVQYQSFFNEYKEPTLKFKKDTITKLMKTYNILLMVEDHPEVIEWAKSKNIMVLVPSTGYKNLNGKDLINDSLQKE